MIFEVSRVKGIVVIYNFLCVWRFKSELIKRKKKYKVFLLMKVKDMLV